MKSGCLKLNNIIDEILKSYKTLVPDGETSNEADTQHYWSFGMTTHEKSQELGINLKTLSQKYYKGAPWSGHRTHTFIFDDNLNKDGNKFIENKIIGFEVKANRGDKFNGHWINQSGIQIIGQKNAKIFVKV